MNLKKKLVLYSGLIALAIISGVLYYTFRASPDSVEKMKADYILAGEEIVSDFEEDETAANNLYLDKTLQISGPITDISSEQEGITIVYIEGSFSGNVSCLFTNEALKDRKIELGEEVVIKGKCTGYILDVVLTKCYLLE